MRYELTDPFGISARLMPSVRVGDAWVSCEPDGSSPDGRTVYRYAIDADGREHEGRDLKSGVGGGDYREGMASLLSFLGHAAECYGGRMRRGEARDADDALFPEWVEKWAYGVSDELASLALQIEDGDADA